MLRNRVLFSLAVNVAIVTGAISFSTRHQRFQESLSLQKEILEAFQVRGGGNAHPSWLVQTNSGRILMPTVMRSLEKLGMPWPHAFSLVRLLTIVAAYILFLQYLRGWFDDSAALAGLLFVAATVPLTFNNWLEIPTDFPELIAFTLAYCALRSDRDGRLVPLVFVATFNRETTFFIPMLVFAVRSRWDSPLSGVRAALPSATAWAVPYVALRWWTGVPLAGAYGSAWDHNLSGLQHFFRNWNLYNDYLYYAWLLGPFWVLPILHRAQLPLLLRRALWTLPAFMFVYLFLGYLNEPRPLLPLYPMLVPAGLFCLFSEHRTKREDLSEVGGVVP